jgi:hypothetical protein
VIPDATTESGHLPARGTPMQGKLGEAVESSVDKNKFKQSFFAAEVART